MGAELRDHRGTPPGLACVQADRQRTVDAGEIRLSKPRPGATRPRRAGRGSVEANTVKPLSKNPGALHFLEEPETNRVVERWNRTLKEQAIYGRVFHNLADVRAAVAAFVERYNQCWRLEKLAYRTPLEAREQYELRHAA